MGNIDAVVNTNNNNTDLMNYEPTEAVLHSTNCGLYTGGIF